MEFVVDYMQLRFDGGGIDGGPAVLNCYVWPRVESGGREWRESDLGYADVLRRLIPATVTATTEADGVGLRIELGAEAIVIDPGLEEVVVEIAELMGFADGAWMTWRPGEDVFEHLV
ncbi:hypothetical protein [Homoserinibacter sp. YIM 151385]|uniref:hypothetical protein n=1 Tax=Homoserinibacter sp. YIM 151385 TaxID=2985506 RepID=UPI0022F0361A|nr:hypothetical protein [Homoserinibacter sp. YIM 151385]WBU38099.1 hypothetical protein OF852_00515 [Homoserinibacter sp. YIM 151385]